MRRWLPGLLVPAMLGVVVCGGSEEHTPTGAGPAVVTIESQTCRRPQVRTGVGTLLADGVALTAAHVVDDQLRTLEVDGRPARVVASSTATDLALVAAETSPDRSIDAARRWFATIEDAAPAPVERSAAVVLLSPAGSRPTTVERLVTLRVDDLSAGAVHERRALVLATGSRPGDSGSPVLDGAGAVVGVLVLRRSDTSGSYATRIPPWPTASDLVGDRPHNTTQSAGSTTPTVARAAPCT